MVWYNSLAWGWACLYSFLSLHFWFSWVLLLKSVLRMRQPCTKQSNTNSAYLNAAFEQTCPWFLGLGLRVLGPGLDNNLKFSWTLVCFDFSGFELDNINKLAVGSPTRRLSFWKNAPISLLTFNKKSFDSELIKTDKNSSVDIATALIKFLRGFLNMNLSSFTN